MVDDTNVKLISEKDLDEFVNKLIDNKTYNVMGVKAKGERFVFDHLDNAKELRLDYDVTILPPKKYFLPPSEKLMDFNITKSFDIKKSKKSKKRIIIGIHPYDIIAIQQMDKYYLDSQKDDFYKKRRENTIIIGSDIQNVSKHSFAESMKTHTTYSGFDILLTNLGNKYAVTIGSKQGNDLLEKYGHFRDAKKSELKKIDKIRNQIASQYDKKVDIDKEEWSKYLVANYNNTLWEEKSDKCMSCSSCTMVCPTCYCYNILDDVSLNLKEGGRIRTWDGCLLKDFTKVGSGEIFRDDKKERYRHRFYRKGNYLPERYGFVACVGCGRCAIACLPNIADPCEVMNTLSSFDKSAETDKYFIKQQTKVPDKGTIHIPRSATIKNINKLTDRETLIEIKLDDNKSLGHSPGQFVEVSVLGIGEAPISISSPPKKDPTFQLVVRKVGNVTSKLVSLKPGDKIGIRGPFGNGFDIKKLENKNIIFVCAGLGVAPLRSLYLYVTDKKNRKKFKELKILYGCKEPCEAMFLDEFEELKKTSDYECKMTVDKCPKGECWEGEVGLITTLFPKIDYDNSKSKDTISVVCGPPIMYKFAIKSLKDMKIPDKNIYVSLERHMKCGVGKCGHCQINGVYVCKEGPVFRYDKVKKLPEALE
ncbi:hypothetical protein GF374_00635 [Candidatus Woesearchaeota archaeon]|nr:hypothetical protein [Candidatus Woesearchaeota archaeon]